MIELIVILILFLIIDIPVIGYINYNMYKVQFNRINGEEMNNKYIVLSALITYLLLTYGLYNFVVKPNINSDNYIEIFKQGSLLGLIIYGIYNGTNISTINKWGLKESLIDTLWGTILSGLLSILSIYIIKKIRN